MNKRFAIGDIFEVQLDSPTIGFFQYVACDASQLNSDVIRVFKRKHCAGDAFDLSHVVNGGVDFHAHVLLGIGVKQKIWRKVGSGYSTGTVDVLFRDSNDYGKSKSTTSKDWYVWKINGPFVQVGELPETYRNAEVGVVVPPDSLAYRMKNGAYDFFYPEPG